MHALTLDFVLAWTEESRIIVQMGHPVRGIARRKLLPVASELGILSVDESKVLMYMSLKIEKKTGNDGLIIKGTTKAHPGE